MSIIINTNISSMQGIRALNKSTGSLNQALERLSTGYRINSSKDDAAGCAISASLRKDISSLTVAQSNAQMGQSMIDTANGSLSNISTLLQRMRDLTEQAANGTYGADERKAMQTEVNNLLSELQRTKTSTEFNGKQIFGKAITSKEDAIEQGYTVVSTAQELKEALRTNDPNCKVMLFADINLDDLETVDGSNWTAVGTGWNTSTAFCGTFDGNGFTISNLKINKPDTNCQGLFGSTAGATIKNVTLENVDVTGSQHTGGLVGATTNNSTISNCSSSGSVTGSDRTGGLVGATVNNSTISNCSSSGTVIGNQMTGGLVGSNQGGTIIENCNSQSTVTGASMYTGGLVGVNHWSAIIKNSSSSGVATGKNFTGGLVGQCNNDAKIINCTSSGSVAGSSTGGLVGRTQSNATITNSKTTSTVSSTGTKGAFLGSTDSSGTLSGNEYNSTINEGMRAVGSGLPTPTEDQIVDNTDLHIDPVVTDPSIGSQIPKVAFGVGVDTTCNLQVGIKNDSDSTIQLDTGLAWGELNIDLSTETTARTALERIDTVMSKITNKQTELGAMSNRLMTAMEYQEVQKSANIATNSVIKDADFAKESSNYIKSQILQNTTASLLATANQNPSIALMLVTGTNLNK